jgi:hypothetical protein
MSDQTVQQYNFLCVLSGVSELTPEFSDALFHEVDAEIELNLRDGICYLECVRSASSLHDAVLETIGEIEGAASGIRVVRVETQDPSVVARINAQLLSTVTIS